MATVVLGEALVGQQRHAAAESVLAPLHGEVAALDEVLRMRYAQIRALALGTELGRVDDAVAVLETTLATFQAGPRRNLLEARVADLLADCGHFRDAAPLAEARITAMADDEVAALCSFVAEGLIRTLSGRCLDTLDLCDLMVPVAMQHVDDIPAGIGWIAAQRMLALYALGDLDQAEEFGRAIETLVVDDPDTTLRAGVLMFRGMVVADQGKLDEGLRLLQQAAALHELDNRRGYQAFCFAITSRVHAQRGEIAAAELALGEARRHLWPGGQVFSSDIDAAAIWVSMLRGDRAGAERILDEAIAHARERRHDHRRGISAARVHPRRARPDASRRRDLYDSQRWNKAVARPSGPPTRLRSPPGTAPDLPTRRSASPSSGTTCAWPKHSRRRRARYRHAGSPSLAAQAPR